MSSKEKNSITVETTVKAPVEKVWKCWTTPEDVMQWNRASPDWHTPRARNDLRIGGQFVYRMEARDGSVGFDFGGTYDTVELYRRIAYTMEDGRTVSVSFEGNGSETRITEIFEAENENSLELQRMGWQAILDNFKKYTES